jgi:hypothetical protein
VLWDRERVSERSGETKYKGYKRRQRTSQQLQRGKSIQRRRLEIGEFGDEKYFKDEDKEKRQPSGKAK